MKLLHLPQFQDRNIALFYLLTIFNNAFFLMGNWIFFWLRFMTYGQLGWIDAICFGFGMLMEIPTGAISDLIGKKKTLTVAMALAAIGFFTIGLGNDQYQILLGFLIAQAGWAFYSGAAEALAYDSLKEKKAEKHFDKVISVSHSLLIATMVVSALVGIKLYEWNFRLPHLGLAVSYSLAFVLTFFLREPKVDSEVFSISNYFAQLKQGFHELLLPALKKYLLLMFVLLGVTYMFGYGLVKPALAENFGFMAREQGFIFAGISLMSAVLVNFVPQMRQKLNDMQGFGLLLGILGSGFILGGLVNGWWGALILAMILGVEALASPWVSVVVNREIDSRYRATTLSTISMATKVPYILVAVVAGGLIENGLIREFSIAVGSLIFAVVIVSTFITKRASR
jgi:MFS family permease